MEEFCLLKYASKITNGPCLLTFDGIERKEFGDKGMKSINKICKSEQKNYKMKICTSRERNKCNNFGNGVSSFGGGWSRGSMNNKNNDENNMIVSK